MKIKLCWILLITSFFSFNQDVFSTNTYMLYLKDKTVISEEKLLLLFSSKAIEKRKLRNIPYAVTDFPINENYIKIVENIVPIQESLKWMNALVVAANKEQFIQLKRLSFIQEISLLKKSVVLKSSKNKFSSEFELNAYGSAKNQIEMLKGNALHDSGYTGKGMDIAVFDNGFLQLDSISFFKKALTEGRIKAIKNIVNNSNQLYNLGGHGTNVMSCMASFNKDTFIGTAPDANYYLFVTEDNNSESKLEEVNWAKAAEMADSMGIDIINSSLGYTDFDDLSTNYTYSDMDGKTTIVSKAAELASQKGILVVNSAGNEGNKAWHYISAPADAKTVLAIGALDNNAQLANFSGRGPSFDLRIKPDIVAQGASVAIVNTSGNPTLSNGTSFSSPIIAGMAACLWQTYPSATNLEVREAIIKSTDKLNFPNNEMGYGLPNFLIAKGILQEKIKKSIQPITVFPVPFKNFVNIYHDIALFQVYALEVYDQKGFFVRKATIEANSNLLGFKAVDLSDLAIGAYFLKIISNNEVIIKRILKE